jgi:hypothetical protein
VERRKKRGDESIQIIVHIYIEMSQRNNVYSYLKQKCLFFFFYINREQEGKTGPVWGSGTSWRGEDIRKGNKRMNMVEILRVHI